MTFSIAPFHASGYPLLNECKDENSLKRGYVKHVLNPSTHFESNHTWEAGELLELPVETLQLLYLNLRHVFTDTCIDSDRLEIVKCLLTISQDQWPEVLKQLAFIMPYNTRGHDLKWAMQILTSVNNPEYRMKLVHVAHRFFEFDTLTVERGYILQALAKLDMEALKNIDKASEETRAAFIKTNVPDSLKESNRIVSTYDAVLKKSWNV